MDLGSTGLGLGFAGRQIWFQAEGEKVWWKDRKSELEAGLLVEVEFKFSSMSHTS